MPRYTITVTATITTTGTLTLDAPDAAAAEAQAEAQLDAAWRAAPNDWHTIEDVLEGAQITHELEIEAVDEA
jgi:hypothetical protein